MKYDPVIRTQIGVAGPDLAVSPGGQTYSRQSSHSDNWDRGKIYNWGRGKIYIYFVPFNVDGINDRKSGL